MARVCRRQQCSVERRGFRQELDSWRHKLIHRVGEALHRCPSRPAGGRPCVGGNRAAAAALRPRAPSRARPPPPPPGAQARGRGAPPLGSWGGLGRAASPQSPAHCGRRARRRRLRAGTRRDARGRPHLPSSRAPPPRRRRAPCPRARAAALGRVRGVRWRWGRREPELSQAPRPPERAKWGVMAAGGSGCTSSAGSGGRGVSPRRTGRCVRICVWRARGREAGVGAGRGSP